MRLGALFGAMLSAAIAAIIHYASVDGKETVVPFVGIVCAPMIGLVVSIGVGMGARALQQVRESDALLGWIGGAAGFVAACPLAYITVAGIPADRLGLAGVGVLAAVALSLYLTAGMVAAVVTASVCRRVGVLHRVLFGLCERCGYPLNLEQQDRCPECGDVIRSDPELAASREQS